MSNRSYKSMSESQKRVVLERLRRNQLKKQLRMWRAGMRPHPPTLRKPLRGADDIYITFGLTPGVDVFVPITRLPFNATQEEKDGEYFVTQMAREEFLNKKGQAARPARAVTSDMPADLGDIVLAVNERNLNE